MCNIQNVCISWLKSIWIIQQEEKCVLKKTKKWVHMDLLFWYYQQWFINSAQPLRPGRLVLSTYSYSHGINFSCCGSVAPSWTLSRKSFYFASTVLLFLTLLCLPSPDQPRVSLARMERPAPPDPPALLYVPSFHALRCELGFDINVVSPISISYSSVKKRVLVKIPQI